VIDGIQLQRQPRGAFVSTDFSAKLGGAAKFFPQGLHPNSLAPRNW
jgi:hypothetical protein